MRSDGTGYQLAVSGNKARTVAGHPDRFSRMHDEKSLVPASSSDGGGGSFIKPHIGIAFITDQDDIMTST